MRLAHLHGRRLRPRSGPRRRPDPSLRAEPPCVDDGDEPPRVVGWVEYRETHRNQRSRWVSLPLNPSYRTTELNHLSESEHQFPRPSAPAGVSSPRAIFSGHQNRSVRLSRGHSPPIPRVLGAPSAVQIRPDGTATFGGS